MIRADRLLVACAATALLGAAPAELETKPGVGVLCMGTLIYLAQLQADTCHAGKDPEYDQRLRNYRDRFDVYLIRNLPEGKAALERFKKDQGVSSPADKRICSVGEDYNFYGHWRNSPREDLDEAVNTLLERDGKPTFGDCL